MGVGRRLRKVSSVKVANLQGMRTNKLWDGKARTSDGVRTGGFCSRAARRFEDRWLGGKGRLVLSRALQKKQVCFGYRSRQL